MQIYIQKSQSQYIYGDMYSDNHTYGAKVHAEVSIADTRCCKCLFSKYTCVLRTQMLHEFIHYNLNIFIFFDIGIVPIVFSTNTI